MQLLSIPRKKRIYAIAFAPNGRELAAACGDGLLRIWDLTTGEVRRWVSIETSQVAFGSSAAALRRSSGFDIAYLDDNRLVFAGTELRRWDIGANVWCIVEQVFGSAMKLSVSPNGKLLAEVSQTASIDWGGPGLIVHEIGPEDIQRLNIAQESAIHTTGGIAFSPDSRFLATGHMLRVGEKRRYVGYVPSGYAVNDYEYVVHIRDMANGNIIESIDGWRQGVTRLAYSPDGRFLAGTAGPRLRIVDIEGHCEVARHTNSTRHFQGLAFTADGRYLATVSNDETVRIWETNTWQAHTTFTWKIGALLNIAVSPEGLRAAVGSNKGQIVIWDLEE